jgi:peptide/nickel transport system substrate-binding protein
MSARRRNLTILAVVLVVIIVGSVGYYYYTQQQQLAKATSTVIIGTTDKITSMDTAQTYDFFTWETLWNTNEGLLKMTPGTLQIAPGLADPSFGGGKGYEISSDGLVYTFKLRANVKFSNGDPVDANAVKYGIDRVVRIHDPQGVDWLVTSFVKSVDVVDPLTLTITLLDPISYFPSIVALNPVYFAVDSKEYPADTINPDGKVGYGPYLIANWQRDVELDLAANPNYYGTPPQTPNIVIKFYKDATTLRLALQNGEIDIARGLNPTDIVDFQSMPAFKVTASDAGRIRYIIFTNIAKPPYNDIHVRQALALALDRDAILSRVFKGQGVPLYSMIPSWLWGHIDAFKDKWPYDLTKAQGELTAAGYSETNKLNIELWYTPSHYGDTEADVAAVLKESWEKTGMVAVTLKSAEWGTYTSYIGSGTMPLYLLGWYPDFIDPDDYISPFYLQGNAYSQNYSNPQMNTLIRQGQTTTDESARTSIYQQIEGIAATDIPYIPMYQGNIYAVSKASVTGLVIDATFIVKYNIISKQA